VCYISSDRLIQFCKRSSAVLEDRLLVLRLKYGSRDAFCRIYEKYRDDLLRLAVYLSSDTAVAEDIVHDVFANFIRSCRRFHLSGSLKAYLATCVANRARNVNRASRRRRQTKSTMIVSPPGPTIIQRHNSSGKPSKRVSAASSRSSSPPHVSTYAPCRSLPHIIRKFSESTNFSLDKLSHFGYFPYTSNDGDHLTGKH
jgi:RNA polymerase sigma factor (sigma-70 family)